jgi:hypothetical protein
VYERGRIPWVRHDPSCIPQRTVHAGRLTLVPLADAHLEWEVELDSDPEVMRYHGTVLTEQTDQALIASPAMLRPARTADAGAIAEIWHRGWQDGHLALVPQEWRRPTEPSPGS